MTWCIWLKALIKHAAAWAFALFPVCQDAAVVCVIIAVNPDSSAFCILMYKMPGIFVNVYFRNIIFIIIINFYDTQQKFPITSILQDLYSITVIHIASASAARFANNLFFAVRAGLLCALFHAGQPYFMAACGTDARYVTASFHVVIKEVCRHDWTVYPPFQAAWQALYPFHTV